MIFDSAYCNSPLCAPARAVFMTGQRASTNRVYDNAAEFRSDIPTFAHYLRRAGYFTILSGKMHFCGPDQLHGFEQRLTTDIYPADFGWTPDWTNFDERPSWYHNMSSVTDAGPSVRTNQLDFDEEVVFAAQKKLYDLVRTGDGRPFCMVVSLTHLHDPFTITEEYWNLYRDDEIDLPRVRIPVEARPHSKRLRFVCAQDAEPVTEAQIRAARHAYTGRSRSSTLRWAVPQDLARSPTHRRHDRHVPRRPWRNARRARPLVQDELLRRFESRAPLLVSAPGRFTPRRIAKSVSPSTSCRRSSTSPTTAPRRPTRRTSTAKAFCRIFRASDGHDLVLGEYLAEGAVAPIVMIRQGRYKFVHCPADPDMLFDLAEDPDELRQPRRRAGCGPRGELPGADPEDLGPGAAAARGDLESAAPAVRDGGAQGRSAPSVGPSTLRGREPALHAQHHRPRRPRAQGPLPAGSHRLIGRRRARRETQRATRSQKPKIAAVLVGRGKVLRKSSAPPFSILN